MAKLCDKTIHSEGGEITVCCCDGNKCNDESFVKKCQEESNSRSYIISAHFISLITALFISSIVL